MNNNGKHIKHECIYNSSLPMRVSSVKDTADFVTSSFVSPSRTVRSHCVCLFPVSDEPQDYV